MTGSVWFLDLDLDEDDEDAAAATDLFVRRAWTQCRYFGNPSAECLSMLPVYCSQEVQKVGGQPAHLSTWPGYSSVRTCLAETVGFASEQSEPLALASLVRPGAFLVGAPPPPRLVTRGRALGAMIKKCPVATKELKRTKRTMSNVVCMTNHALQQSCTAH